VPLQGRYITSRSENINFKQLSAALKQEFPKLPIEDAAAHPDADKVVLDNSKVGAGRSLPKSTPCFPLGSPVK